MSDRFDVRIKNTDLVIKKLLDKQKRLGPDSQEIRKKLIYIATLITNQAKINIRRHGLIDTGRLINSLLWEFFKDGERQGIRIGSFGVPYAAFWEFGFSGRMSIRAHNRLITQAFGRPLEQARIVRVRSHSRTVNQPAKPYLRPAYERHKDKITKILLDSV
jgi:hypothetical protein